MINRAGFTLVELMVVIGVFAILASIATPNFFSWMDNARVSRASRQIFSSILDARTHSIKANSTTTIEFFETGESYVTRKWSPETNELHEKTHTLPAGVKIAAAFGNGRILSYDSRGLPGSKGNVVLTNNSGRTTRILVNFNGSVRIANN